MYNYKYLVNKILKNGIVKYDRTGVGTYALFGERLEFDLENGFPLVTTKKMFWKGIVHEVIWFLSGNTNIKYLEDNGITIWREWADKNGDLGPVYGYLWRNFNGDGIDQIKNVINDIKKIPDSRRLIVTVWNPSQQHLMALPPCINFLQFYVDRGKLSLQIYQRSADVFLGLPFDIAEYSLLLMMIAHVTGLKPGKLIHVLGDVHIYRNHLTIISRQMQKKCLPLPTVELNKEIKNIDDFTFDDIKLLNYQSHEKLSGEIAV